MKTSQTPPDVLIIGAGPAGLSVGRALKRRGLRPLLVERDEVGATWRHVPEDLRVLSPWWTNILDARSLVGANPLSRVRARKFRDHLLDFASRAGLDIVEGAEICSLNHAGSRWTALGRDGRQWQASNVVCATGYFTTPFIPQSPFSSDGTIPAIHASSIRDYDLFASEHGGKHILLVGKRVTAGQLMLELVDRGCRVTLSARKPVGFRRSGLVGELLDQAYFFYEEGRVRFQPGLQANSYPAMDGGRTERLVSTGDVRVVPRPHRISAGSVQLEDGTAIPADVVIFATGYRPALPYLEGICDLDARTGLPRLDGFEIVGAPGIFALGFDNARNFRSRYLRGIRADARLLANTLARRIRGGA